MTLKHILIATLAATALAGCEQGTGPIRYPVPQVDAKERIGISYASVLVREISLPTYASTEEISVARGDGSLQSFSDSLWADDPVRAVTLDLTRNLRQITRAIVAPEPWPFTDSPEVAVDVRIEEIVADPSGRFTLAGIYFTAPDEEERHRHSNLFRLAVPYDPAAGVGAIAAARADAIAALARLIAREGLH